MRSDFGTAFESQKIRKRGMKLNGIASTCETKKTPITITKDEKLQNAYCYFVHHYA